MKKALLACSIIVSSLFFGYSQALAQDVNINLNACITSGGNRLCMNTATGQYVLVDAQGRGISGNANTGAVSGSGTIGGVRVNGTGVLGTEGAAGNGTLGSVGGPNGTGLLGLLALAQTIVVRLAPLLMGVALLAFFWFLIEFIWKGNDNPDEQKKAKKGMIWSIVALFVMVSIWGIIGFLGGVLGINQGGSIPGFTLPGS